MHVESGEIVQLTDFDKNVSLNSNGVLPDGRVYGIVENRLFTVDIDTLEEAVLFKSGGLWFGHDDPVTFQRGEGQFIIVKVQDGSAIGLVLVPIEGSRNRTVLESDHPLRVSSLLITPDSKHIIYHRKEKSALVR